MPTVDAIAVAELSAPHGVRGWVRVHLYDRDSEALRPGLHVELRPPQGAHGPSAIPMRILAVEPVPGKAVLRVHFAEIDSRDRAEALRGHEVWVARADLPALEEDEFYLTDTIGLPVERALSEDRTQPLGTIVGVTSNGVQDLLEVQYVRPDGRKDTWLLPALPQFIVDVDAERLRVVLPIGLLPDTLESAGEGP